MENSKKTAKLEVVWRNPYPPVRITSKIQRLCRDEFGALYAVLSSGVAEEFELILGRTA